MAEEKEIKKSKKKITAKKKKIDKEVVENKSKKKKNYTSKETIIVMILSIIIGLLFGSAVTRYLCEDKNPKGLAEFNEIYTDISENKYGRVSSSDMLYSSVNGLLSSLNDRYAYIVESKNSQIQYEQDTKGEFNGLGVNIYLNEEGKIFVNSIINNSPAEKAGLESGDIITKLNGEDYNAANYDDFSNVLQTSKKGDKVTVEILRNDNTFEKEIKLDKVVLESVFYEMIEKDGLRIGVFTINNFANNTCDQFLDKYEEGLKDGIKGMIIDVRSNKEGLMKNAADIASLFLDKGEVLYQTYNNGVYEKVESKTKREIKLPVTVVVNEETKASGEMIASTLNENLGAPIVGNKTYGKGLLQKVLHLYNGYTISYTTKEWVTSKKKMVEQVGIEPTIKAENVEGYTSDDYIEKATDSIKKILNNNM